ncbi:MAG: type II toxin-antitoxin system RelE/ParE family toxin [Chlamydiae bacterium]|nr:type II toxin-antitoxin system RelE/ParE family toxin [Chlamydiota bacterium]
MNTPHHPIPVVFYREEPSGNEPVREWICGLDKETRKEIGRDIRAVQLRWPLGMPLVRNLGGGLWEIRSHIHNGIARVIFKMIKGEIVLLHGLVKKTSKTPLDDLKLAKNRAKKYEAEGA